MQSLCRTAPWIVGEMAEAPRAEGFEWGMTALPAVAEGGDQYSYTWFEQAWIPSGAANVDAAKTVYSIPLQRHSM